VGALSAMKRAGIGLRFAPAALDLAKFAWAGFGLKEPDPIVAVQMLGVIRKLHHKATMLIRVAFYRSGRLGWLYQLGGWLLLPCAAGLYYIALCRDPFSAEVFIFDDKAKCPLFR
jgi:hypothetical protein